VIGGSAVPPSMIERLASLYGCTVLQVWGMTETSPLGTMCTPTPALATLSPEDQRKKLQTAGRVQYGMELKIVDPNGERLSHDGKNPGDLWVRSGWAAKGYFRDETSRLDADGWFPTWPRSTISVTCGLPTGPRMSSNPAGSRSVRSTSRASPMRIRP
jgi:acyl-CoA synthetase (AMP-forming)/AMP-acid ligase II